MTNNQREFQKQINRLQREIRNLQIKHNVKTHKSLPEQPKHITRAKLDEFKSLKGKDFVDIEEHKPRRSRKEDETHARKVRPKNYVRPPYEPVDERATRSDKGTHRDTPSPLKGRPSPLKGRPSPLKGKPSPLKGTHRDKPSPLKGTHLSAEERARRNAKRQETIRKKKERTPVDGLDFAPNNTAPDKPFNMIERILELIEEAESKCHDQHQIHKYAKTWDGFERMSYLVMLKMLVSSNYDSASYYDSIASRENEIAQLLNNIALYRPEDIDDDTPPLDPNTSYNRLYELLTPDGLIDMETNKEVTEANEQYVWELLG